MGISCAAWLSELAVVLALVGSARGQTCGTGWVYGADRGIDGVQGRVYALTMWDPDGAGPTSPVLVVGGDFELAGEVRTSNIAAWDPQTRRWSAIGAGLTPFVESVVRSLAVMENGDLVAGGYFGVDGAESSGVARWDGTAWRAMGAGFDGSIDAMVAGPGLPGGLKLVIGGNFVGVDGTLYHDVAGWDGARWVQAGFPLVKAVNGITKLPGGVLGFGGWAGATVTAASWDGSAWTALWSGRGLDVESVGIWQGQMLVGGLFYEVGGPSARAVARRHGSEWVRLGEEFDRDINVLLTLANGDVVAGGEFTQVGDVPALGVARWDGERWSAMGTGIGSYWGGRVCALTKLPDGRIVAGGQFNQTASAPAGAIAIWDGHGWGPLGRALNGSVYSAVEGQDGSVIVGGTFTSVGGETVNGVARWSGAEWSPLGSGIDMDIRGPFFFGHLPVVNAVAAMPDGSVIAAGTFLSMGGAEASGIARWDGKEWSALGAGLGGYFTPYPDALALLPDGDLVVAGQFEMAGGETVNHIARWDGRSWHAMEKGMNSEEGYGVQVMALAVMPDGDVIAGGFFGYAGDRRVNNIARWDGEAWSALAGGTEGDIWALLVTPGGDLIAGGQFSSIGGVLAQNIARWDGVRWWPLGTGTNDSVTGLVLLPDGDVLASGRFTKAGGVQAARIARWNGSAWLAVGDGIEGTWDTFVRALVALRNGEVLFSGSFTTVAGELSPNWARWSETGVPWIASSPEKVGGSCGGSASFAAHPADGYGELTYTWRRDGAEIDLTDPRIVVESGPGGSTLTIMGLSGADAGSYVCVVSNGCGGSSSAGAELSVACCEADLDADGIVDFADVLAFLTLFDALDPRVDFTHDGIVDIADYLEFLNLFEAGC